MNEKKALKPSYKTQLETRKKKQKPKKKTSTNIQTNKNDIVRLLTNEFNSR